MASYTPLPVSGEHLEPGPYEPYGRGRPSEEYLQSEGYEMQAGVGSRPSSPQPSYSTNEPATRYDSSRYEPSRYSDVEKDGLIGGQVHYRTYKRRYFGLILLAVLNIVHAWASLQFGIITTETAKYFGVTEIDINAISVVGAILYLPVAPLVIWTSARHGPKMAMIVSSVVLVIGGWLRYLGVRIHSFPLAFAGSAVMAIGQPFVVSVPTRYSKLWFSEKGRTGATAFATLSEVLGSGVGAAVTPLLFKAYGMGSQILVLTVIMTGVSIPVFFIPKEPPTPASAVSAAHTLSIRDGLKLLPKIPAFYLQFFSFSVAYAAINATTNLITQAIAVYGESDQVAGTATAILVFGGVAVSAIVSPIIDKTHSHVIAIKIIAVILAGAFTALIWVPQSRSAAALYADFAVIGAAALSVTPCVLEFQSRWTHPVPPELSSTICWTGGHLAQAVYIVIMDALTNRTEDLGQPRGSLIKGFIFQAAVVWALVPCAFLTGVWIFKRPAASLVAN